MRILQDRDGHTNVRLIILAFVILSGIAAALLYFPPVPTRTGSETAGEITFFDGGGDPLAGIVRISGDGIPGGSAVSSGLKWGRIPNASIYFNASDTKNVTINLWIGGDSPNGKVILENYGINPPGSIKLFAPETPVKYLQVSAEGILFVRADISIKYRDMEVEGLNENNLAIYHYDASNSTWDKLATVVDALNNTLSTSVNSLSIFAVAASAAGITETHPGAEVEIPVGLTGNVTVQGLVSDINSNQLKVHIKKLRVKGSSPLQAQTGSTYDFNDVPSGEYISFDASDTKRVSASFRIRGNSSNSKIILDDYKKSNPVPVEPPGTPVKFVDVSAVNVNFSEVEIRVYYTDDELGGQDESRLVIYHWSGESWDALPTAVDAANNVLTATATSLSPFAVSASGGLKTILVATNRYSITSFNSASVALSGYDSDNSSFTFTGGAMVIDSNGLPVSGENVYYEIKSAAGTLKANGTKATGSNGLALFSYNTTRDFTSDTDSDYGTWTVMARLVSNTSVSRNVTVNISITGYTSSCSKGYCHHNPNDIDNSGSSQTSPRSPYSDKFGISGTGLSMAAGAHIGRNHGSVQCITCHPGYGSNDKTKDYHSSFTCNSANCHSTYGSTWPIPIPSCYNASCHPKLNKNMTNISTLATIGGISNVSIYSTTSGSTVIPYAVHNGSQYSNKTGVPCWICHGPMHNITKPDSLPGNKNNITEYTQCTLCHNAYKRHNNSVSCTVCHSQDAHLIKVFAQNSTYIAGAASIWRGNCTNCHQNSTFLGALLSQPKAGNYTGSQPQIPIVQHSNDELNGSKWNFTNPYWTNTSQVTTCKYCHGETMHKTSALGRPSLFSGSNPVNGTISTSLTWCQQCHWQQSSDYSSMVSTYVEDSKTVPPEITGNASYAPTGGASDGTSYYAHNSVNKDDSSCKNCHGTFEGGTSVTYFMHSLVMVIGSSMSSFGNSSCISCHDTDSSGATHKINNSDMNNGVHADLNKNAINSTNASAQNKKCWGCHTSNGSEPGDMGDRYSDPYKCYDCHNSTSKPYVNVSNALNVSEHFISGSSIKTANATTNLSSCIGCHNQTEMKVDYTEGDAYSSNYSLASHYGKKRTDLRIGTSTNCSYCHQNSSTAFLSAMLEPAYNSSIKNHSQNYVSPDCTNSNCHNTGWLHNDTLNKTVLTLPESAFCLNCHGSGGSNASIKNIEKHNNTVNCSSCHLNASKDIHPIKYRQNDNLTWNTTNASAVNCTSCHQGAGLGGVFSTATKVARPMLHSDNSYNGSLWGSYWQNTSQLSTCVYCHTNSSLHNSSGLGKVSQVKYTNNKGQTLTGNSHWCANCHYNSSSYTNITYRYNGTAYSSVPPNISEFKGTTASDGTAWFNHTLENYSDTKCKECHGLRLSQFTTDEFVHNVSKGGGGTACTSCHEYGAPGGAPDDKRINVTSMRLGVHKNLNRNATNTTAVDSIDKACWACHGDGIEPTGHPAKYKVPYACVDCHNRTANYTTSNTTLLDDITSKKVYDHIQAPYRESIGSNVWNPAVNCLLCHNKSKANFTDSIAPADYVAANVSHYANYSNLITPTYNCTICHQTPGNNATWYANLTRHPAKSQNYTFCANCHNSTNATTFHSQPLIWTPTIHGYADNPGFDWEGDDATNGAGGILNQSDEACASCHSGGTTKLCENCHLPNTTSVFTGPFNTGGFLRKDINDTLPYVYSHNNYSYLTGTNINVPPLNNPGYATGCYYYNNGTGEGSCHGNPYYNRTSAGGYYAFRGSSVIRNVSDPAHRTKTIDRLPDTSNCLFCHNQSNTTIRKAWGNAFQVNSSNMFGNRYDVTRTESCYVCHTSDNSTPNDFHSRTVTTGGGPGCLGCHNTSTPQGYAGMRYIDGGNFSISVHARMNSNNASGFGINASCWACHNSSGAVVQNNTHPDKKTTPYDCTDCHLASGSRAGAYNATIVSEHFINGSQIRTSNATSNLTSCLNCHENVSEMVLRNNDTDYGTFAGDGISLTGGNTSFYHYGRPRTELRVNTVSTNCSYCHQNASTVFKIAMADKVYSSNISNHSSLYNDTNPSCSACHNTGWLHNDTITKPTLVLPNSSFCLGCHGDNGGGSTNYTNAVTGVKERHNNTLNCTKCHLYTNRSIHPVQYLQADNGWSTTKTNAVNCTTCHQGSGMTSFSTAPKVPSPMNHSTNPYSGALWNGTQQGYWLNTSQQSACNYCHSTRALHNSSGLGNVSRIRGNNSKNQSLTGGNWCANCHYNGSAPSGNYNYKGNTFTPQPPEIYNLSRLVPAKARDGTSFFNHSGSIPAYDDDACKACHNSALGAGATSLNFSHDVRSGGGGPDCVSCHDINVSGKTGKKINVSAMKVGVHRNLNGNATNSTALTSNISKTCWACHGDGTENTVHPTSSSVPYACINCHNRTANITYTDLSRVDDLNSRKVYDHIQTPYRESIGSNVWNPAVDCVLCHNKSKANFTDSIAPADYVAANVSHYANYSNLITPTYNCTICHKSPENNVTWYANLTRHPAKSQNYTFCANCHNSTNATTFHSQPLIWTPTIHGYADNPGFDWEGDDATNGAGGILNQSDEACASCHSGGTTKLCENCHLPNTTSVFTGPFNTGGFLRKDINDTLPYVYSHNNYSYLTGTNINVPPLNNPGYATGCYYYNNGTGEGSCHGNPYYNRTSAGGYYAFRGSSVIRNVSDPAHRTKTIDRLPDTSNCLFCHNQSNTTIRKAWGNAFQVNSSNMFGNRYDVNKTESCYVCHTSDNSTPVDFHSATVTTGGGPGCLGCHNTSTPQSYTGIRYIDGGNFTRSVHASMNSGNASGYGLNASCWACHNTSGTVVQNNTHPDKKTTPYDCTDCHLASGRRAGAYNASIVSEHFINGSQIRTSNATSNLTSCLNCHENASEMVLRNNDTDYGTFAGDGISLTGGNTSFYHYGRPRTELRVNTVSTNCSYCHQNASTVFKIAMADKVYSSNISNHSSLYNDTNPSCSACHNTGWLHNDTITKPTLVLPNSSFCLGCHGDNGAGGTNYTGAITGVKEKHNNSINCTACHLENNKSIHPVKYLDPNGASWNTSKANAINCTACHQGTGLNNFSGAPNIPDPLKHSSNLSNGSIWGNYWNSTQVSSSSCYYCHNNTKHNKTALGKINSMLAPADANNTRNGSLSTTTWCADCHYNATININYKGSEWNPAPPLITYNNVGKSRWVDHTSYLSGGYRDINCNLCHALNGSYQSTSQNYSHSLNEGISGGPDCKSCHNVGGSAGPGRLVNFSAMNSTESLHKNLNTGASASVDTENKKCWSCHGNGSEPALGSHPSKYRTPYNCTDCHIPDIGQNMNFTPKSVLNVTQHYWNGASISTANVTSCYGCHNKSEMTLGNLDPDGNASVFGGANGGNGSTSHYGRKRTDYPAQGTNDYCYRCHNNASSIFPFIDANNRTISNHSSLYPDTNPDCTECHAVVPGRLHNDTLYKPIFAAWPNSTYCLTCHGSGGSASIRNLEKHNGTSPTGVNCTECHLNSTRSIHPVRYLQKGGTTWETVRTNAVNCTDCHQSVLSQNFSTAPIVPDPVKHSSNLSNGSIWGSYWNSSQASSSCYYCHNNTKHNNTALGRINSLLAPADANNTRNGLLTTTTWCADCHYNDSNSNYQGSLWNPVPPLVTFNNVGKSRWKDHTAYLTGGYKDSNCNLCHALNGTYQSTSLNYSHSLDEGISGGPDCKSCHNVGGQAGPGKLVNFSAMNSTGSIHMNLNSEAPISDANYSENRKCWSCHGSGSEPAAGEHPARYRTPYNCTDCHVPGAGQNMNFTPKSILNVTQHYWNASNIRTLNVTTCYSCHNRSEMMLGSVDPDGNATVYGGANGGNNSPNHYGRKRGAELRVWDSGLAVNCSYCHQNSSTAFSTAMLEPAYNSSIMNHSQNYVSPDCTNSNCHNSGWLHNDTLNKTVLTLPESAFCLNCHGTSGSNATIKNIEKHNGTVNCSSCHLNTSRDIHPVRYRQNDNLTWNTTNVSAVNCTSCHQGSGLGGMFSTATKVAKPMAHSDNSYNGSLWGSYWQNTSQLSQCVYCHTNSSLHNGSGLGKVSQIQYANNKGQQLTGNSHWCANCHYNSSAYTNVTYRYNGTAYTPVPPNISEFKGITASDGTAWFNHSLENYSDTKCKECHGLRISQFTSDEFVHNVSKGGGGPACTSCHEYGAPGGAPNDKRINVTSMRLGVHKNLNSNAVNTTAIDPINKACWACHGDGIEPTGHPAKYKVPYACVDCHNRTANYTTLNSTLLDDITSKKVYDHIQTPYRESIGSNVWNPAVNCTLCHNKSKASFTDYITPSDYVAANVSHYANYSNLITPTYNCTICHKSPVNNVTWYANLTRHPAKSQNYTFCANCHNSTNATTFHSQPLIWTPTIHGYADNPGFDWEGDDATNGAGGILNQSDEACASCHSGGTTKLCENCHLPNTTSVFTGPFNTGGFLRKDINDTIPYVYSHNNYSYLTGTNINVPPLNNPGYATSCYYYNNGTGEGSCHGNPYYNRTSAGGYYAFRGSSVIRNVSDPAHRTKTIDRLPDTSNCLFCHNQSNTTIRKAWGNAFQVNSSNMFGNRYDVNKTESCYICHTSDNSTPVDFHSRTVTTGGGPGCLGCHNTSSSQSYSGLRHIDGGNFSRSVHANMNSNNASGYGMNASCWACHNSSGTVVSNNTHPDKKTTPYDCTDCHLAGGSRAGAYNAPLVSEHFINGAQIKTSNATSNLTSCLNCHENVSEMLLRNSDTDYGTFTGDGITPTGGNTSFYHYGRPRTELRMNAVSTNCSYCHQNISTVFKIAMAYPDYNSSIANHSSTYSSTNPVCTGCHNTGWLHNDTVTKPVLTLPNSSFCLDCHGAGGDASIKNLERHNSTLNCTQCHLNTSRSIHPVRYLQQDSNWSTAKTNVVNCTTCHQGFGLTNFSTAPKVPSPMNHSTNPYSGALWNGTQQGYWLNTSQASACNYCHSTRALHNSSGLGNVSRIQGSNSKNQSLTGGNWCANCHYNGSAPSGNYNYKGNTFTPQPPEIYNISGLVPAKARDGITSFFNHSGSIPTYDDDACKACHNSALGAGATSLNFSHDVKSGGGGPDCISCHDIDVSGKTSKKINVSAMKVGVHRNLNSNATNSTALTSNISKTCWACHGDGTENTIHPTSTSVPYACADCHNRTANLTNTDTGRTEDLNSRKVYDHIQTPYRESIGSNVWNPAVNCILCHNKSKANFTDSIAPADYVAANVSHYANYSNLITPTYNCTICHKSPVNNVTWYANLTRHPAKSQNYTFCSNCHNSTTAETFHSQPLIWTPTIHGYADNPGFDWEGDDATNGAGGILNQSDEACASCHSGGTTKLCENCHLPNTTSVFTGPFNTGGFLREDINDTLPYVYSHNNYSYLTGTNVNVPPLNNPGYATSCYYYNNGTGEGSCHGNPYYNRSSAGGYYAFRGSSVIRNVSDPAHRTKTIDRLPDTSNCLFCHNQSNTTIRKAWGNAFQVNSSNMFGNLYDINRKESCYVCHTSDNQTPKDFHSSTLVTGGGPGCLGCHNTSTSGSYTGMHYIDGGNFSRSVHANMNSGNESGYGINASCWACHNSSGTPVQNRTHPDRKTTPYNCTDCHLSGGSRAGAYNATVISNHFRNGTSIRALDNQTTDIASCIGCHENVSGMLVPNNDKETGSFAGDGIRATGGNMSFYHYGANRSSFNKVPGSYGYCIYCHRNNTGEFNITFQDAANRSILNHSSRFDSSNPACGTRGCHNSTDSGLHGYELAKPNLSLPDSSYCLGCHGKNSTSGLINFTGAVTSTKEKHNNTVDCTKCHLNTSSSIHPVRYLGQDGLTWGTSNASAVNCTNCHQGSGLNNFSNAPKVSIRVQHSDNLTNGSIWNKTRPYWTNTSQQSMCNYCHGDSRHNDSAVGRPANWSGSNTLNSSITGSSNWCSGCHYQGYSNSGMSYGNMTGTFEGANRTVPPEITNHSTYAPYGIGGYYNHSLTPDYNDTTCKGCHGKSLTGDQIKEFVHNVSTGVCTSCHYSYEYMNSVNRPERFVNRTMFEASPHGILKCEDCHTKGHNNTAARKACEDCHAVQQDPKTDRDRHNITRDPLSYSIPGVSGSVVYITDCTTCHNATIFNEAVKNYGPGKAKQCEYCHTYPDKGYS